MNWLVPALLTGTIAFSATNLDDIVFLTVFFSQARRSWHVVVGQYLGFTALLLVSLIGFFGGHIVPQNWLRLLGIAPMAIGVKKLREARKDETLRADSGVFSIAAVTFLNGADNIGIYAPLFALSDTRRLIVLVAVLYVLLAVWCAVGYLIHRNKAVAYALKRWGHCVVPVVLIALGAYILFG
jgi:cadmium resistance protein CadD (predicted permease)